MEEATTSSMFSGERERGAGGKFKNPASRKPQSTPYDRPNSSAVAVEPLSKSPASRRKGRGWISKIVDPARRLVSGGANKMFSSYFSQHPKSDIPASLDTEDHGLRQDASMNDLTIIDNFGMPKSSRQAYPVKVADEPKHAYGTHVHEENQEQNLCSDDFLSGVEQMLKSKSFSREERGRLAGIVQSRASDISDENKGKKIANLGVRTQSEGFVRSQATPRMYFKEKQEDFNGAMLHDVGDSPIDVAKSYMWGNQTPRGGIGSKSTTFKDDKALAHVNESTLKPFAPSPQPNNLPICWPGAVVPDQGGGLTPRSQSARIGLHNFPRTPYSRTIYSNTKTKLPQSQHNRSSYYESPTNEAATSLFGTQTNVTLPHSQANKSSYYESPSNGTAFPLFRTPTNETIHSKDNAAFGSVQPIRKTTHDSLSGTPRKPVSAISSKNGPSFHTGTSNNPRGSLAFNKFESGSPNHASRFRSMESNPSSSDAGILARRISKHIEKSIPNPNPKEKPDALNLPCKSYKTSDLVDPKFPAQINEEPQNSLINARLTTGKSLALGDSDLRSPFGSRSDSASEVRVFGQNDTIQKDKSQVRPLHDNQSNGQFHNEFPSHKPPSCSSRAKRGLGSISIQKSDIKTPTCDTDEGCNFSFPVSNLGSEPPTPSLKPPAPSLGPSSLPAGSCEPDVKFATPKFEFASKKSSQPLVFSFRGAKTDAPDIVFNFGSDNHNRSSSNLLNNDTFF